MKTCQEPIALIEDRLRPIITAERHRGTEVAVAEFANQFSGQAGAPDFSGAESYREGDMVRLGGALRAFTAADVKAGHLPSSQGIEAYGSGLERWNVIVNTISPDGWTWQGLMDSLSYTRAYTEPVNVWNSEFVGGDITVDTPDDDAALLARIAEQRRKYAERSKDTAETWHTVHPCIYDLSKMEMSVAVQEEAVYRKTVLDEESMYETKENKVTHVDAESTDEQYASAKCMYENLQSKQDKITYDADEEALTIN